MKEERNVCLCSGVGVNWWFVLVALVALFGGFYFLSALSKPAQSQIYISTNGSVSEHNTISTTGSADEKVNPDMLTVYYSVRTEGATAKEAQQENARIANAINSALKSLGIEEKNIKTTSYSVDVKRESHYICDNESGKSDCYWTYVDVGYVVTHSLAFEMYDFAKSGDAVDAVGSAGGEVDSVSFGLKPETRRAVSARLLGNAAAEAKNKAEAIASAVGTSVVKTMSISESFYYSPIVYNKAVSASMENVPTTALESGTIDVSVSVSAVFEVK